MITFKLHFVNTEIRLKSFIRNKAKEAKRFIWDIEFKQN